MEKKFEECEHLNIVPRKNLTFYCKDCGYDSTKASGKLSNLMKQLNKCRKGNADLAITFSETTADLQKRLGILRQMVREKDKEIEELNLQIEVITSE